MEPTVTAPAIIDALTSGQIGLGVALIVLAIVAVFRRLEVVHLVDGTPGLIFAATLAGLGTAAGIVAMGGDLLSALSAGITAALGATSGAAVKAVE